MAQSYRAKKGRPPLGKRLEPRRRGCRRGLAAVCRIARGRAGPVRTDRRRWSSRLGRERPGDGRAARGARPGGLAGARLGARLQSRRAGRHDRAAGKAARGNRRRPAGAGGRVEPRRRLRARAGARGARAGAGGRDARLALFRRPAHQNNVWRLYERVAGHPVDEPPIRISPTSRRCRRWRSGRGKRRHRRPAVGARAGGRARQGGGAELHPHGIRRVARAGAAVAREIEKFLEEVEQSSALSGPPSKLRKAGAGSTAFELRNRRVAETRTKLEQKRCESCGKRLVSGRRRSCLRCGV